MQDNAIGGPAAQSVPGSLQEVFVSGAAQEVPVPGSPQEDRVCGSVQEAPVPGSPAALRQRPIGILDSGLGGLTALRELRALLPGEDILYLGDTARLPYGGRSQQELCAFGAQNIAFFMRRQVKSVLIACGTLSATLSQDFLNSFAVPVEGVLAPTVQQAVQTTQNGRIGVIATQASHRTGAYRRALLALRPQAEVLSLGCPSFVPLIESGRTGVQDSAVRTAVARELAPLRGSGIDTLILGCTHFPLLSEAISAFLPGVALIDAGAAAARSCAARLRRQDLLNPAPTGSTTFFVTGDRESFQKNGSVFLGQHIERVLPAQLDGQG